MVHEAAKLLVVDDDPVLRTVISCTFARAGYRVSTAADGFAALAELRRDTPDLLLSDLNMPGMSGLALLSEVRRRFPAIRTVAMSSDFSGHEVPAGVMADSFYPKASGIADLLHLIEALPPGRAVRDMASGNRGLDDPSSLPVALAG